MRRASAEGVARQADTALLQDRLGLLGLTGVRDVEVHENQSVLVSVTERGVLRIHRGFAYAADRVLQAVVTFADPGAPSGAQRRARRALAAFPVEEFVRRRRSPRRSRPGADERVVRELRRRHEDLNRRHFAGRLAPVAFRLSGRMETRLGELTVDGRTGRPTEIAISRRHLAEDGWDEVEHTLLHEMVHQWQVETGGEADHGEQFRAKAREVGIAPTAMRSVQERASLGKRLDEEQGCLFEAWTSTTSSRS